MAVLTRSKTVYLPVGEGVGWGDTLATQIDQAIHRAGVDRDVVSVTVTPIALGFPTGGSPTGGVVVSVIWREAGAAGPAT